jgi:hypothetical protein
MNNVVFSFSGVDHCRVRSSTLCGSCFGSQVKLGVYLVLDVSDQLFLGSYPFSLTEQVHDSIIGVLVAPRNDLRVVFHGQQTSVNLFSCQFAHIRELLEQQEKQGFKSFLSEFFIFNDEHV